MENVMVFVFQFLMFLVLICSYILMCLVNFTSGHSLFPALSLCSPLCFIFFFIIRVSLPVCLFPHVSPASAFSGPVLFLVSLRLLLMFFSLVFLQFCKQFHPGLYFIWLFYSPVLFWIFPSLFCQWRFLLSSSPGFWFLTTAYVIKVSFLVP